MDAAALLLCCAALCCAVLGCATPPGEILRANESSPAWPAPPLKPRVVFLGQFATANDLRPGRSFWQKLVSTLFGAKQPGALVTPQGLLLTPSRELLVVDLSLIHI